MTNYLDYPEAEETPTKNCPDCEGSGYVGEELCCRNLTHDQRKDCCNKPMKEVCERCEGKGWLEMSEEEVREEEEATEDHYGEMRETELNDER